MESSDVSLAPALQFSPCPSATEDVSRFVVTGQYPQGIRSGMAAVVGLYALRARATIRGILVQVLVTLKARPDTKFDDDHYTGFHFQLVRETIRARVGN